MSARKINNLAQPLVLNGAVEFKRDLDVRDVQVSGVITGGGITDDILGDDNTFTGKNDFQNTLTSGDVTDPAGFNMLRKDKTDAYALNFTSVDRDNSWNRAAFTNALNNPITPTNLSGLPVADDDISNLGDLNDYILSSANPLQDNNTWLGQQDFQGGEAKLGFTTQSPAIPTLTNDAICKKYVDGVIEIAGKTLTFSYNVAGTYTITPPTEPIGTIIKIDILMYGAGSIASGGALQYYPAFNSISLGDLNNNIPSMVIYVGAAQTNVVPLSAIPSQSAIDVESNTYVTFIGKVIGGCQGIYTDDITDPAAPVLVLPHAMTPNGQGSPVGFWTQGNQVNVAPTPFGRCPFENLTRGVGAANSNGRVDVIVHYS